MTVNDLSLTTQIFGGIIALYFFVTSYKSLSKGFWVLLLSALTTWGVIYLVQASEYTIFAVQFITGFSFLAWFVGSVLGELLG
ncbi:hypothetical protein ACP26L_36215 (plasmid) [Paenibacillus sp. S-38]|uniref:hypothetical protein n=1 Tax=Paenibacillus sp. S-38 TaxID=3416710 RepID=UPI003CEC0ACC